MEIAPAEKPCNRRFVPSAGEIAAVEAKTNQIIKDLGKKFDPFDYPKIKLIVAKMMIPGIYSRHLYKYFAGLELTKEAALGRVRRTVTRVKTKYPEIFEGFLNKDVVDIDEHLKNLSDIALDVKNEGTDKKTRVQASRALIGAAVEVEKLAKTTVKETVNYNDVFSKLNMGSVYEQPIPGEPEPQE